MVKFTRVLLLAIMTMLGLVACSAVDVSTENSATGNAATLGLPAGKPAFLISYADW